MDLQNGYKVIYEEAKDGKRTIYAAKSNKYPTDDDKELATFNCADYAGKVIYGHEDKIYVSEGSTPKYDENGIPTDPVLSDAFDEVFVTKTEQGEPEETVVEEEPTVEPEDETPETDETGDEEPVVDTEE